MSDAYCGNCNRDNVIPSTKYPDEVYCGQCGWQERVETPESVGEATE